MLGLVEVDTQRSVVDRTHCLIVIVAVRNPSTSLSFNPRCGYTGLQQSKSDHVMIQTKFATSFPNVLERKASACRLGGFDPLSATVTLCLERRPWPKENAKDEALRSEN